MERLCWSTLNLLGSDTSSRRIDRTMLDPAAWIRWKERLSMLLEPYGLSINDVDIERLRGYFERHLSPPSAAAKIAQKESI